MHRIISHPAYIDGGGLRHPPRQERLVMTAEEEQEHLAQQAIDTEESRSDHLAQQERERVREAALAKIQAVTGLTDEELEVWAESLPER